MMKRTTLLFALLLMTTITQSTYSSQLSSSSSSSSGAISHEIVEKRQVVNRYAQRSLWNRCVDTVKHHSGKLAFVILSTAICRHASEVFFLQKPWNSITLLLPYAAAIPFLNVVFQTSRLWNVVGYRNDNVGYYSFDAAKSALSSGADVHAKFSNEFTLLHYAISCGMSDMITLLLEHGADPNVKSNKGETPLHGAYSKGNVEILFAGGADVNVKNNEGNTPLHLAVKYKGVEIVQSLIKHGADVNAKNNKGETPLHDAVYGALWSNRSSLIITVLLDSGAEVHAKNKGSESPLSFAARCHERYFFGDVITLLLQAKSFRCDAEEDCIKKLLFVVVKKKLLYDEKVRNQNINLLELLIKKGVDVNASRDLYNNTLLHLAVSDCYVEMVRLLLRHGADVHATNEDGWTPLHDAAAYNKSEVIEELLKVEKIDVNALTNKGNTPLDIAILNERKDAIELLLQADGLHLNVQSKKIKHLLFLAVDNNWIVILQQLIAKGVDINEKNESGNTPLHLAIMHGKQKEIIELLKVERLNINSKNNGKETPLDCAIKCKNKKAIKLLINDKRFEFNGVQMEQLLLLVVEKGWVEIMQALVEQYKFADIKVLDSIGSTLLHYAVHFGQVKMADFLIKGGIEIDAQNIFDSTALYCAVFRGNITITKLLIEAGANLNIRNRVNNATLLDIAIFKNDVAIIELLLQAKTLKLDAQNKKIEGLLFLAVKEGWTTIVQLLVEKEVNVNATDKIGFVPLGIAIEFVHKKIIELLLNEKKTDLDVTSVQAENLLFYAVSEGWEVIVRQLIERGMSVNIVEFDKKFTPLHLAICNGYMKIVELLIKNKADVNAVNSKSLTPLDVAIKCNQREMVELLLNQDSLSFDVQSEKAQQLLFHAVANNWPNVVQWLVNKGVDVNQKNKYSYTPLDTAIRKSYKEVVTALLQANNIEIKEVTKHYPMSEILALDCEALIQYLITNTSFFNKILEGGTTEDAVLYQVRSTEVLQLFVQPEEFKKHANLTVVHAAMQDGYNESLVLHYMQLYKKNGREVPLYDYHGRTVLTAAVNTIVNSKNPAIVKKKVKQYLSFFSIEELLAMIKQEDEKKKNVLAYIEFFQRDVQQAINAELVSDAIFARMKKLKGLSHEDIVSCGLCRGEVFQLAPLYCSINGQHALHKGCLDRLKKNKNDNKCLYCQSDAWYEQYPHQGITYYDGYHVIVPRQRAPLEK